ncbi:retrovirus-related pol polyprotein from transposon TNT 1-94 [Tanacetum coccineum]
MNANPGQARQVKCYNYNSIVHIARNCTQPKRPQNSEYFKDKMLLMQAQENRVSLDEERLLFLAGRQDNAVDEDVDEQPVQDLALNMDNVFQADDCDAFDSDVDEAPTSQTMFMANLSSANHVYDEAEHEMHDDVQPNYVVDLHADYTSDSNMIPYDQYIKSCTISSKTTRNTVVDNSLTAELATYKEQVELYERRARFELTEREQKIDEQLRIVITDRNIKEENLKKELHSVKFQLASTINHNKSRVEEVTSLKKHFKQKENKYLEEFLDMKALKEKVEDKLYKQDQSLQTVHMLCKPKPYYDELNKATASRPIKALTVYPPNTPATLVPRVLPTKSQVKINIFALIQLFSDFEKTCNKRITPTGLTEGERGFEQTKACYLTEVIPFFKTLKEHFEGIQKALTKEIKEMKDIFEELEAEVDQNGVDRKHDEIERKNLLIANDNLIADCLSKEVFYVATNSELNVSSFTKMHDAHTSLKARCLELKVELSNLHDKIQKDNHDELIKRFFNLEVNHLNLQLKYQNLKESFGNNTSPPTRDVPNFDSVFVIEKIKASIQGKDNAIKKLRMQTSQLNETRSEADRTLDFRTLDFQITQLTKKINVLQEQNELFRAENGKIKQHYKELYDSIKIIRAKHLDQTTALLTKNESLKVQIQNKLSCVNKDHVKPKVLAPGKYAIDVEPISPHNRNNRVVHLVYLKHLKESVETLREIIEEAKVEILLDSSLASACSYTKHYKELLEYVIGTCPKALNIRDNKHASTSLPKKKQVTFEEQCALSKRVNSCTDASISQPRSNTKKNRILPAKSVNMKKVEEHPRIIKSSLKTTNCVDSSISSKHTVVQIVLWYLDSGCSKDMMGDRLRLRNFVKKFIRMVRFGNDHFGAIIGYGDYVISESVISKEAFLLCLRYGCEDLGQLQPTANIGIFIGYASSRKGYRIYNKRTRRIMETFHVQFDELTKHMAPVQLNRGPAPTFLMLGQISSGLVPNSVLAAPFVPPTNKELEILFQPMFDEYMEPPRVERPVYPAPTVLVPINLAGTPSSTTIDQDAPFPSHSPSSLAFQSPSLHKGVAADSTLIEDNPFALIDNHPFINVFAQEPSSEASSSGDISSTESPYVSQTLHHLEKWSKDHPLDNIIGNPSLPVSIRKQLATDALWCLYNSVLSKVEQKNFKSAITEDGWFQAMQDEIQEFD